MPRVRDEHGEFVRVTAYVAGITTALPSVAAWRFQECPQCGLRHGASQLPDQSKRLTIIEESYCSEECRAEAEMLEKDRQEQDGAA